MGRKKKKKRAVILSNEDSSGDSDHELDPELDDKKSQSKRNAHELLQNKESAYKEHCSQVPSTSQVGIF